MVFIDPITRQRIVAAKYSGDIEYESQQGSSAVDNESVEVIGPWSDENQDGVKGTFTTGGESTKVLMNSPVPNSFWGTKAGLEGAKLGNLNEVGQEKSYIRREKIYKTMDVPKDQF